MRMVFVTGGVMHSEFRRDVERMRDPDNHLLSVVLRWLRFSCRVYKLSSSTGRAENSSGRAEY